MLKLSICFRLINTILFAHLANIRMFFKDFASHKLTLYLLQHMRQTNVQHFAL